jgi:hypothetical protein
MRIKRIKSADQTDRSSPGRAPCAGALLLSIHIPKVFCFSGCGGEIRYASESVANRRAPVASTPVVTIRVDPCR